MQLIRCTNFQRFLPKGATRPFLCSAEDGRLYVVKAQGNPLGSKVLLNEYVTGVLANCIGLSWPNVRIVQLSKDIIHKLRERDFEVESELAVGIEYIEGLQEINQPKSISYSDPKFNDINAQHILNIFHNERYLDAFYGKSVIDNWLLMRDTTYDTLQKTIDGRPLFLDASDSLGGLDWDVDKLMFDNIFFDTSIYLCGFELKLEKFNPWLHKIRKLSTSTYNYTLDSLPDEWNVPTNFTDRTIDFLYKTNEIFLENFCEKIEIENFNKAQHGHSL